jgi:glutamyl-tRNA(Gln) amidotransferase subunit E
MGVKGLFHSDELPNYGITQEEKDLIYKKLDCNKTEDAFIIIADEKIISEKAIKVVIKRASDFTLHKCVRTARVDGTSSFMRPMPGSSRLYPETDLFSIDLSKYQVTIPKLLSDRIEEMMKEFNLANDVCKKLIKDEIDMFSLIKEYPNVKASYIVDYYFSLPSLIKKKYVIDIDVRKFEHQIFSKLNQNKISKDSVVQILINLEKNQPFNYDDFKPISIDEVKKEIKKIVEENKSLPKGAIIGKVMAKYSGKVDGKEITDLITKLLN